MPLPGDLPQLTRISDFVRHHAKATPDREALVLGDDRLSYRDLDLAADACARRLTACGLGPGDRLAMLTTPRPEFVIALIAAQRCGAIWVGLNPAYRLPEFRHILEDCRPKLLLALTRGPDRDYLEDLRSLDRLGLVETIITFPDQVEGIGPCPRPVPKDAPALCDPPPDESEATVIVYTSGTSGRPKGALLSHRNLLFSYLSVSRSFEGREELRDGLRLLCNLPPNHIGCISEMAGNTLIRGGTLVFNERFDPGQAIRTIERERITLVGGVPPMLQAIFDHPDMLTANLSSLRMIGWGGAPAPRALVERMQRLGVHLFTNYGLTEGGAVVTATGPRPTTGELCGTVGRPYSPREARIVKEDGTDAAAGETGEIWLQGPGVFLGYWNNPAATKAAFTSDGWLRTGDTASATVNGSWLLRGRTAEMFKSGGYNVYPREIELVLEEHPAVAIAAVVAVPDPTYFEVGHAFIQLEPDRRVGSDDLLAFARERLANYKLPKSIRFREALPLLAIGKVDRAALRAEARAPVATSE